MPLKRRGPTPLQKWGRSQRISLGLEPPIKRRKRKPKDVSVDPLTRRLPGIFDKPKIKKKSKNSKRKSVE